MKSKQTELDFYSSITSWVCHNCQSFCVWSERRGKYKTYSFSFQSHQSKWQNYITSASRKSLFHLFILILISAIHLTISANNSLSLIILWKLFATTFSKPISWENNLQEWRKYEFFKALRKCLKNMCFCY